MSVPFDLTCWYLNARRIVEITKVAPSPSPTEVDGQMARLVHLMQLKNAVVTWMGANGPPSLEVLLAQEKVVPGVVFTHHSNFFFSGLSKIAAALEKNKPNKLAVGYSKLDGWRPDGRLQFDFDYEHLTSNSSWSELSGQARKFVLGVVKDVTGNTINCIPYVIANIVDANSSLSGYPGAWFNHLEVHVSQIDSFAKANNLHNSLTKACLAPLKNVSEANIKAALAEIINEPTVPKDWGGEASDLFTSRLLLNGHRISTAFLLKGPAKFHPMTPADLGKNGDQIGRLFGEPADLLVLQHCHEVTPAVRRQMRAYAQQMGNPRQFCVIDGYDTLRILQAYGKCGMSVPSGSSSQS